MHLSRNMKTQKSWFPKVIQWVRAWGIEMAFYSDPGLKPLELLTPSLSVPGGLFFEGGGHPEWRQGVGQDGLTCFVFCFPGWRPVLSIIELHFAQKHLTKRDFKEDYIVLDYFYCRTYSKYVNSLRFPWPLEAVKHTWEMCQLSSRGLKGIKDSLGVQFHL